MESNRPYTISGRRLAGALILALLLGAASPLLTVLEVSLLLPVIALGGVFLVFLYFYGGRIPGAVFLTTFLASAALLLDDALMWMLLAAGSLPGVVCIHGIARKRPFFDQLRIGVAVYMAGMLAALGIAYARYGGGIIAQAANALLRQFDLLPDDFFEPFVETINAALAQGNIIGIRAMTVQGYREQIAGFMSLAVETYEAALPGALLGGAAASGVLSTLWGSWLMARRGLATNESYVPINRWFLPAQVTVGLTLVWFAAYLLGQGGYGAGESVYQAAFDLLTVAFYFQALGAIDRFFYRRGVPDRGRRRRVAVAAVLGALFRYLGLAMFVIGGCSAMFGSHGASKSFRNRRNDGNE